ncbi:hypothetical protein GUJ93_ZPchr0007g3640 [Zizania palustris]|uniref:Uncharacterized protein n=1 Tax=Zizania palustris TaxID=103762 RepID=A0A8J5TBV7_ZIZPA|nr:hypothetical protein GUJ93_ZPchr0007g3640 [Zizania palustris]
MVAVAEPALRFRLRTAAASPPRCRASSSAYSYSKIARSFPIQRVNWGRMQPLDALKGHVLRSYGNHDGRFYIMRITSLAATDKQEPIASPSTDASLVEETESSTGDSPASDSSYFTDQSVGKPGFISFQGSNYRMRSVESVPHPGKEASRLVWFVGPTILVAFLVLPSLYLRRVLSAVFEDSLLTDFLILFFTEALFYGGVAIFVLLIDKVWRPLQQVAPKSYIWSKSRFFRISSVTTMVLSLIIPLLTMGMVWPWTGPAASATLAPYLASPTEQSCSAGYSTHLFCSRNRGNKSDLGYHELLRSTIDCSSNSWRYLCMVSLQFSNEVSSLFRHSRSLTSSSCGSSVLLKIMGIGFLEFLL